MWRLQPKHIWRYSSEIVEVHHHQDWLLMTLASWPQLLFQMLTAMQVSIYESHSIQYDIVRHIWLTCSLLACMRPPRLPEMQPLQRCGRKSPICSLLLPSAAAAGALLWPRCAAGTQACADQLPCGPSRGAAARSSVPHQARLHRHRCK